MSDAARLVDELTTLLYEVTTGWDDSAGGHQIVRCGACRRKADRAESVVHESDCPVYRLIRAEEANTAVIRANAEEIADLEDVRDELEAQVNALTAQMECRNELTARIRALEVENERGQQAFADLTLASVERINALEAERDALRARAERAEAARDRALIVAVRPVYEPPPPAPEWQRYECRVCREVGLIAETISHARGCPIAALAGSRAVLAPSSAEGEGA